jgi:hypothetical protein
VGGSAQGLPSTCNASGEEPAGLGNCLYDPSNPKAREYLWSKLKTSYYDQGITQFWTDGTEPAGAPKNGLPVDIAFHGAENAFVEPFFVMYVMYKRPIYQDRLWTNTGTDNGGRKGCSACGRRNPRQRVLDDVAGLALPDSL